MSLWGGGGSGGGSQGPMIARWGNGPNDVEEIRSDRVSESLTGIEWGHKKIHGGGTFQINISNIDINSTPLRIKIEIPAQDKRIHMLAFGVSSGESIFTITENPTGGATGGSVVTPQNRRRDSLQTSVATWTTGVSAPTGGIVLGPDPERHGFDKDKISGETRATAEWVLGDTLSATVYVVELESSISDVVGNLLIDWYEQKDKN